MIVGLCGYNKREQAGDEKLAARSKSEIHIPSLGIAADVIRYNG